MNINFDDLFTLKYFKIRRMIINGSHSQKVATQFLYSVRFLNVIDLVLENVSLNFVINKLIKILVCLNEVKRLIIVVLFSKF